MHRINNTTYILLTNQYYRGNSMAAIILDRNDLLISFVIVAIELVDNCMNHTVNRNDRLRF